MSTFEGRSLLCLADFTADEIRALLDLSHQVKRESQEPEVRRRFAGKSLAMLFEKRSTRTRAAFETAFGEEGGHPVFLSSQDIQLGEKETIEDTARVLGRMFDAIEFRGFKQSSVELLAQHSGVPVVNGLTDRWHPTQALADLMTIEEERGPVHRAAVAYFGDGRNNVCNSLLIACAKMGTTLTVVCPEELSPSREVQSQVKRFAAQSGATITVTHSPAEIGPVDAVYTDVWVSMGEESRSADRIRLLRPYQVTEETLSAAGDAVFLHCLPAVRGNEMTSEVIDGMRSRVFVQAENRKHTIKAVLLALLGSA